MSSMQTVENVINGFFTTVSNAANTGVLNSAGVGLLFSIMSMLIIWNTLRTLLEGGGARKMMAESIGLVMMGSIALLLIEDTVGVKTIVHDSIEGIASATTGTSGANGFTKVYQGVFPMFQAIENIWDAEAPPANAPSWTEIIQNPEILGTYVLGGLGMMLLSFGLKLIAIVILLLAGLVSMCQFMVSQVLIYIAFILAPIFIPFIVWDKASFLFDGWLRFFIKACFYKVIGMIMIGLLAGTISQATTMVTNMPANNVIDAQTVRISALIGIILIATIIAYLMGQIGSIADGLISGSAGQGFKMGKIKMPRAGGASSGSTPKPQNATTTSSSFKDGQMQSQTTTTVKSGSGGSTTKSVTTDGGGNVTKISTTKTGSGGGGFFRKG